MGYTYTNGSVVYLEFTFDWPCYTLIGCIWQTPPSPGFGVGRVLDGAPGEGGALSVNFALSCVLVIVLGLRATVRGRGFTRPCYSLLRWGQKQAHLKTAVGNRGTGRTDFPARS